MTTMSKVKIPISATIPLQGNSIWGDTKGQKVKVSAIIFEADLEDTDYPICYIWVEHDKKWEIYTDTGFEKGVTDLVTKILGQPVKVNWTEQGMQNNRKASMETVSRAGGKVIRDFVAKKKGK